MITREKRSSVVRYWLEKAEESMASARREFEAGSLSFAMNRLYYSAFYAVSALLMDRELSFKKHSGVRAAFHKRFIKTGLLEQKWGRLYDQLFEDRQEGDYVVFISFESNYVETQLARCAEFLEHVSRLILSVPE
ncbi:putative toxin-antitoxin system, antitoxin component [delta proteobacterium NaphS2]|nr:putative toxin-antitoxin system, antitoxin component [delta proteobacterium NaphS2]